MSANHILQNFLSAGKIPPSGKRPLQTSLFLFFVFDFLLLLLLMSRPSYTIVHIVHNLKPQLNENES